MRKTTLERKTNETDIKLTVDIDGQGNANIDTGIGFFDHMLSALAAHACMDLSLVCKGDLKVDTHHTIEDVGIVLGKALKQALGEAPIARYGSFFVPMDEALGFCSMDICGRSYLVFDCAFDNSKIGEMDSCMVAEFFRSLSTNAGITLHLKVLYGTNDHHKCEALFKAFAHALRAAAAQREGTLSTKGALD